MAEPCRLPRKTRVAGPRLAAPLGPLDPRDHAWREDLADIALADLVAVPNYVAPAEMLVVRQAPLLGADSADAPAVSELLPGERFAVLDTGHGFAWGFGLHDHYVGHIALDALAPADTAVTTPIGPGDALLFAEPRVKAEVRGTLPMGARVGWQDHDERFVKLTAGPGAGLFLHRRHLLLAPVTDWVAAAEQFVGTPYRWGGRSRAGVDCSGVVQVARMLGGHACRRDSDMQAADAAADVPPGEARRGDLACWPGHIGVMLDGERLLHANAHWMACVVEPLADVVARAAASEGPAAPRLRRP
jgi:cell wall-associated NlpC family hydrolase